MKNYWIVKTREDDEGKPMVDYWPQFKNRNMNNGHTIIAVGWGDGPEEHNFTKQELTDYIRDRFYSGSITRAKIGANTIWKFMNEMKEGDEVLVCKGFNSRQKAPVRVYGIATITGGSWVDANSSWKFRRKRNVEYTQIIEKDIDVEIFAKLIGKGSSMLTIHSIGEDHFNNTREWIIENFFSSKRNPSWTRDELILALNLYFSYDHIPSSEQDPKIVELSNILNEFPIHPDFLHKPNFRNPNGVYMKLCNFLRLDPNYHGEGLNAGSKLDIEVWDEFHMDKKRLVEVAEQIVKGYKRLLSKNDSAKEISEDEEFPEGKIVTRLHSLKERNQDLVNKKKTLVLQQTGQLACECCDFDFSQFYGEDYIFAECHHNIPMSEISGAKKVKLQDLSVVCSNCHRVIHKKRPWLTVKDLRQILAERRNIELADG